MTAFDFDKKLDKARHLMQVRNHAEALKLYTRLARQSPDGGFWVEFGHAALISGDIGEAERLWEKARSVAAGKVEVLAQTAAEYEKVGLTAKARELYAETARLEPNNPRVHSRLAQLSLETGPAAEAQGPINRWLALVPGDEGAYLLAAQMAHRSGRLTEAEKQLRDLLAAGVHDSRIKASCQIELAQILDRTGRYNEAIAELEAGKVLLRRGVEAEAELKSVEAWRQKVRSETKSLPRNILEIWSKGFPPKVRTGTASVAYLGGPARSGATLVEKVLDAHPAVAACDESRAFPNILALVDIVGPEIPAQRLSILRERYLKTFGRAAGARPGEKLFLDKNPAPTVFLPAFLRTFPELRVLIAVRDPRDAILSLYFQNRANSNYLTLEQLADHYQCVMDVWLMMREWEGLAWLETRYEDMVADFQKEGTRVTQFLGLDWHPDQARFYEQNRQKPVLSMNYDAVNQPVYSRAVGRWRAYEKHLAPILPMLEPYCRKFGYT